jgi:hypothetical protein
VPRFVVHVGWETPLWLSLRRAGLFCPVTPNLQRELATLSSDSVHIAVKGADHVSLITRREHANSVVEAIRHVMERVNTQGIHREFHRN